MSITSVEISGNHFYIGDRVVVMKKRDSDDKFLISDEHLDNWNRPIIYSLNEIARRRDGDIVLSIKIAEHNVRNPKEPQKSLFKLQIDDSVTIVRVSGRYEEMLRNGVSALQDGDNVTALS